MRCLASGTHSVVVPFWEAIFAFLYFLVAGNYLRLRMLVNFQIVLVALNKVSADCLYSNTAADYDDRYM